MTWQIRHAISLLNHVKCLAHNHFRHLVAIAFDHYFTRWLLNCSTGIHAKEAV